MRISVVFFLCIAVMFLWVPVALAEEDSIYGQCIDQTDDPPPWCYQMTVERVGDPALCENILKYWPRADGVHGVCYYNLARKRKECALCDLIRDADIKKMCRLDVCK